MRKLYIAVLDKVPGFIVPTLVAHSVLSAHLKFSVLDDVVNRKKYFDWLEYSFRKVVVKVNEKEFKKIQKLELPKHFGFENSTLDGMTTCVVVIPLELEETPNVLKFAKLYAP